MPRLGKGWEASIRQRSNLGCWSWEEAILDILSYVGPPDGTRSQLSTWAFPLFSFWASPRPLGATARLRQLPGLQAASSTIATGSFLPFLHTPLGGMHQTLPDAQAASSCGIPGRARKSRNVGVLGPESGIKFQHRRMLHEESASRFLLLQVRIFVN